MKLTASQRLKASKILAAIAAAIVMLDQYGEQIKDAGIQLPHWAVIAIAVIAWLAHSPFVSAPAQDTSTQTPTDPKTEG